MPLLELTASEHARLEAFGQGCAIRGLKALLHRADSLELPSYMGKVEVSNLLAGQPDAKAFIKECIEQSKSRGDIVRLKDLYESYVEYCKDHRVINVLPKRYLTRLMAKAGYPLITLGQNYKGFRFILNNYI